MMRRTTEVTRLQKGALVSGGSIRVASSSVQMQRCR